MRRVLLALYLAGAALPCRAWGAEAQASASGPIVIGMSAPWMEYGSYHWVMRQQAEKTAAALGVKIVFADAVWDMPKQIADVQRFVAQGVQGIILSPMSNQLGPAVDAAVKAGIPVVTDGGLPTTDAVLARVTRDEAEAGRMAAQFMIEKLGNKGTIVEVVAPLGVVPAVDQRRDAFEEVIKRSKIEVIVAKMNGLGRWEGEQAMAKQFRIQPDFVLDGVVAANDSSLFGAIEALRTFGVDPAKKVVVGFDGIPEALQYMREGQLTATVAGFPDKVVDQALRQLVSYLRTGKPPAQKVTLIKPELLTQGAPPAG